MCKSSGVRSLCKACWTFWLLHICRELNDKSKSLQGLNTGKMLAWAVKRLSVALRAWQSHAGSLPLWGAEETWQGSRRQELPSTAKAGFKVSIHFICKFSPPVNRKFQGKNSCPANTENWEPYVSVKKTALLSHPHSGFAAPLSLLSASCPRWVGVTRRLSVASGTTAFQITAVTLWLLLFFSCVNGAVRFSHSKP